MLGQARLEPDARAGRLVDLHAPSRGPVEAQRPVGLEHVGMAAHLDVPIAGIDHLERHDRQAVEDHQVLVGRHDLTRDIGPGDRHLAGPDLLEHRDHLGALDEAALDVEERDHLGDAGQDVVGGQQPAREIADLGIGLVLPGRGQDLVGDQRHGFRMVQLEAQGPVAPGEFGGHEDGQAVHLGRGQVHG